MVKLLPLFIIIILSGNLYAWTSSNDGFLYIMDDISELSDSINYNDALSQYEVRCDIVILENDTLMLNPGEVIKFYDSAILCGIEIYGCLKALGEEANSIVLGDPEFDFSDGEWWNGVKFYDISQDNESSLRYCNIRGVQGSMTNVSIYCENSSPIIDNCIISYMDSAAETGGGTGIFCKGQSYPIVSHCTFENLRNSIAVWCGWHMGGWGWQDTLNYPSPLLIGCNIMQSVSGFWGSYSDLERVVIGGGFLDNCYLGIHDSDSDTTLGIPLDTLGDGVCNTSSTNWFSRFLLVDGVVNPRPTPEWTGVDEEENEILPTISKYLVLNKNYPNPFNPQTTIEFDIHKNYVPVSLKIYNSKGQLVNILIDSEIYQSGRYSVVWKGNNHKGEQVSSGVYFYKLISNDEMQVKQAILVR
jgi:FlgD Ig-like domain